MTATAIVMMIVAITVIWGGLAVSTRYLISHPLPHEGTGPGPAPGPSEGPIPGSYPTHR